MIKKFFILFLYKNKLTYIYNKKMEEQHYYNVKGEDFNNNKKLNLTLAEIKVIYNHFIDVLEEHPTLLTYESVTKKLEEAILDETNISYFYGVNDVVNMEFFDRELTDTAELAIELSVVGGGGKTDEPMVLFMSPNQLDYIQDIYQELNKK